VPIPGDIRIVLNFVAACVTIIAGLIPGPQDGNSLAAGMYGSEAPYGNAATSKVAKPPDGFTPFFIETIGRHGSRTATGDDEENRILKLWEQAKKQGALSENGKTLKRDIERFQAAEKKAGYGQLTSTGKAELAGLGRRTADNYGELFSKAQEDGDTIEFQTSPVNRTKESAAAMKAAIKRKYPDLAFAKDAVKERTLVIGAHASPIGQQHIRRLRSKEIPNVELAAQNILLSLFQPQFVDQVKRPIDRALDMYIIFQRAPSLKAETDVDFKKYVDQGDADVFAQEQAGEKFYRYGPGIRGETTSYQAAKPLLNDFMKRLQQRVDGGKTAAVFRVAHGETLMPFTAITQLRSANQQEPKGGLYKEEFNPWRSWKSGLLAGSVEWVAYRNKAGKVLISLRFNEEPSRFSKACTPTGPSGDFYTLAEIKKCIYSPLGFV
jgi:hypothetical protein